MSLSGPTAGVKEQSQPQAEHTKDQRHWCQEETETHKDREYVLGKATKHLPGKVMIADILTKAPARAVFVDAECFMRSPHGCLDQLAQR